VTFVVGQTGVVVPVPAADPLVSRWRDRFDPAAASGVPPHVTIVYPFVPVDVLTADDLADLRALAAARARFTVSFRSCARFPGVLYLAPSPDGPFRQLTADLVTRWPEAPPYGGVFPDVVPHLTVTDGAREEDSREAEQAITAGLPLTCAVDRLELVVFDGERWAGQASFPLGR